MIEFGSEPVFVYLDLTLKLLEQSKLFKLLHSLIVLVITIVFLYQSFRLLLLPKWPLNGQFSFAYWFPTRLCTINRHCASSGNLVWVTYSLMVSVIFWFLWTSHLMYGTEVLPRKVPSVCKNNKRNTCKFSLVDTSIILQTLLQSKIST